MVFGIRDTKVKEILLRESGLTLAKTDEICRAAESMITQMKIVEDAETDVNKVDTVNASCNRRPNNKINRRRQRGQGQGKQCENCGYQQSANRESCPGFGKDCRRCGARNHFASKCRQDVKAMEEADELTEETYQTEEVSAVKLDDSQLVTLCLESRRFIRFQPGLSAMCYHCTYSDKLTTTKNSRK